MKNLSWMLAALFFLIACFFGYKYFCANNGNSISDVDKTRCAPCMEYNNVGNTSGTLDMNLVKTMAYNFQDAETPSNTRSVWFSLETLKHFIWKIENKTCGCKGNLGIRIYFGKYPIAGDWHIFGSDLSNLETDIMQRFNNVNTYGSINTIFMVPTIDKSDNNGGFYHFDFDPADPNGCTPGYNERYGTAIDTTLSFTHQPFGSSITALMVQNHGDACPPPTPPATACPEIGAYFYY